MTLNRYLALSGQCSRRKAALLIADGRVTVNGKTTTAPWTRVGPHDRVAVDGKPVSAERRVYIILNKPAGVTSTVEDAFARTKIVDLVPGDLGRLYPVGRLDRESRGLIILTNDGELCQRLTHPRFGIEKEYIVTIRGRAEASLPARARKGVRDGGDHLRVTAVRVISALDTRTRMSVIVSEGKKRHLRRLFTALGAVVTDLQRIRIGGLRLGVLREGSYQIMDGELLRKKVLQKRPARCDNAAGGGKKGIC